MSEGDEYILNDRSCWHVKTEPVELMDGRTVARICVRCLSQLPVNHGCENCEWIECRTLGDVVPRYLCGQPCPQHAGVLT